MNRRTFVRNMCLGGIATFGSGAELRALVTRYLAQPELRVAMAERARAAVERFFEAGHQKDFKAACGQLTKEAQRTLEQRAGAAAAQQGRKGCDEILGLFLAKLALGNVVDVRVSGNRAVVDASVRALGGSKGKGKPTTIDLFLIGNAWKIADFGV